jgi:hypothetical protein
MLFRPCIDSQTCQDSYRPSLQGPIALPHLAYGGWPFIRLHKRPPRAKKENCVVPISTCYEPERLDPKLARIQSFEEGVSVTGDYFYGNSPDGEVSGAGSNFGPGVGWSGGATSTYTQIGVLNSIP